MLTEVSELEAALGSGDSSEPPATANKQTNKQKQNKKGAAFRQEAQGPVNPQGKPAPGQPRAERASAGEVGEVAVIVTISFSS